MAENSKELQQIYQKRFDRKAGYRKQVWQVLTSEFFNRWISKDVTVLDLGCGYGEFINHIAARKKLAMDLNPDTPLHLDASVTFLAQDCSAEWKVDSGSLEVVFTSNFFEHLPSKDHLKLTLRQALRCLKPGGKLVAMGPNVKFLPGLHWDFFDHHTILTESSLAEALEMTGFEIEVVVPRFLPYTMVNVPEYPMWMLRAYLRMPWLWRIRGRQFLVVARKPV